jgi:Icc-related predicted phosphoesterase
MKIVAISDVHRLEHYLTLPKGDMLIFSGDYAVNSLLDSMALNMWFEKQDFKYKIYLAGNHDWFLYNNNIKSNKKFLNNCIYLQDELIEIEGLRIYGSPWCPEYNSWAFMKPRGSKDLSEIWSKIPENLDILVTHCPPYQILDESYYHKKCGCEVLAREIIKKEPKYHIFGHIHHSYGHKKIENTTFINCSLLNDQYNMVNKPTIIEI